MIENGANVKPFVPQGVPPFAKRPEQIKMTWWNRIRERCAVVCGLDVRSLALFRICLGGLLLVDLAIRASDLTGMYTDEGFVPVETARKLMASGQWSLYMLSGSAVYVKGLFLLAAALAVALIAGYHTRLATIGCWIMLVSLHVRLPIVLNAGDMLLRLLLFWGMFLPLGRVFSFDARRAAKPLSTRVASVATLALIVQLALMYWGAGLTKLNTTWLQEDALGHVFAIGLYGKPLGQYLFGMPELTRVLSRATVGLELAGPCLLFIPWWTSRVRMVVIASFLMLHIGIAATITVGLFSYVAIAAWLALLPGSFWDLLARKTRSATPPSDDPSDTAEVLNETSLWRRAVRFAGAAVCLLFLVLVIAWNILDFPGGKRANLIHPRIRQLADAAMVSQRWNLFSEPRRFDSWFVYEAVLKDGQFVDLWRNGAEVDHARPELGSRRFANHRWRKLHSQIASDQFAGYRQPLAEYVCRRWNDEHGESEQVARLDVYCYWQYIDDAEEDAYVGHVIAQVVHDVVWPEREPW